MHNLGLICTHKLYANSFKKYVDLNGPKTQLIKPILGEIHLRRLKAIIIFSFTNALLSQFCYVISIFLGVQWSIVSFYGNAGVHAFSTVTKI